jgi:hypothetical protein
MSGTTMLGTTTSDSSQRWADLDSSNERLVEASHPLLRAADRDRTDSDRTGGSAR